MDGGCLPVDDLRVLGYDALVTPRALVSARPLSETGRECVHNTRRAAQRIIQLEDDRLLVIVGPCSIHDPAAALEYAQMLKPVADRLQEDLLVVMRAYFEKPRTTVGWKGLINDPDLDGSFHINKGLHTARTLLCDIVRLYDDGESSCSRCQQNALQVPVAVELLDTISPQFLGDLISWGAIGARTTESQLHRELASGVSFPVGFKNGTNGDVKIAVDAICAANHPHYFMGVNKDGLAAIAKTSGNLDCHIILRGGDEGPNYDEESVEKAARKLKSAGLAPRIMIDCSHGNSFKLCRNQPIVSREIARQVATGDSRICGVMIESNIVEGRQAHDTSKVAASLRYGQSITDECVNFEDTILMLEELAASVRKRRTVPPS